MMQSPERPAEHWLDETAPAASAGGGARSPIESLVLPLFRSRWVLVVALILGAAGGILAGVLQPNEYTSVGKVMVRVGERERIPPDTFDNPSGTAAAQVLSNELHLLGNEGVYRKVAQRIGPQRILAPYDPLRRYGGDDSPPHTRLLHRLQSWYFRKSAGEHQCVEQECPECLYLAQQVLRSPARTGLEFAPRSNVIVVRHTAHDGDLAKRVVDALIAEFDVRHQEIYTARGAVQLLKTRQEEVLREASLADQELIRVHETLGVTDLVAERQKLIDSQYQLDSEIAATTLDIKLAERDLARAETQLAEVVPLTEPVLEQAWERNPAYTKQEEAVESLHRKRAELLVTHTPDARPVRNIEADIAREEAVLGELMPFVRVEKVREPSNSEHAALAQQVEGIRSELADLVTRKTDKEETRASIVARLRYLLDCEPQLAELQMRSQILRKSAEEAAAALESKRVLASLDEAQISNLVVLDWGTLPSSKSGPDRKKILLIGVFAGLAAGAGFAFARSALDGRIHGARDLARAAGVSVLVAVDQDRRLLPAKREP